MDVALGADRHLDITFGLQLDEGHPLFPYFLEKHLAIPTSPFFIYNNNIIINFFRWVFSECTKVIATSLIPLDTILPEK